MDSARDPKHSSKLNQVIQRLTAKEMKGEDHDAQQADGKKRALTAQPKMFLNESGQQVKKEKSASGEGGAKGGKERDFKCTVCGKLFLTCTHLTRHFEVHSEKKNYKCSICNKQFYQAGSLAKHMHIHTAPDGYPCTICDKKFTQKSSLVRHMNLHTGQKAFRCEVCQKTFRRRYAYDAHKVRHVKN